MKVLLSCVAAAVVAGSVGGAAAAAELRYRVQDLNALTGLAELSVQDLNNQGHLTLVDRHSGHGYLYRDGSLQDLGAVSDWGPLKLNERGDVIGTRDGPDRTRQAFLYRDGRFTDLNAALGARSGIAQGLNESGQVVGTADGRAFVYDGAGGRYLDVAGATGSEAQAINDRGVIAGTGLFPGDLVRERAFLARDGRAAFMPQPLELDYGGWYRALDVNNRGNAVVHYLDSNWGEFGSSLYLDGRYTDLGFFTFAQDINEHDWAAGYFVAPVSDDEYVFSAMLYRDGEARSLDRLLVAPDRARWTLDDARALNDRGQVIGMGTLADGSEHAFLATPVPEPGRCALMLAGLGTVGWAARRAQRRRGTGTETLA